MVMRFSNFLDSSPKYTRLLIAPDGLKSNVFGLDTEQKLHVEDVGENEEPKDLSEDNNTLPVDLENPPAQEQINIRIN